MTEGTLATLVRLPLPWPPAQPHLVYCGEELELIGLPDGRLRVTISSSQKVFLSQPIETNSTKPQWALFIITWSASLIRVGVSGINLLQDAPGVPKAVLPLQDPVPDEFSINDPNASVACQKWIQNRAAMFAAPSSPRRDRRLKTRSEQVDDFRNSILRLKNLNQQIAAGSNFLLGTLAGEMRASVYWPKGKDAEPPRNYNPLLLRMANLGGLPLPVYFVPEPTTPATPILAQAIKRGMLHAPRIHREFHPDRVQDLQESLVTSVLRLGKAPGKVITALELIKELAHTGGAAHYDEDASEFVDVLQQMNVARGNQVTVFTCQIADTLVSLSEWVLSELTKRNLIV